MGRTVIEKVAWKVIELEDFEIGPAVKYFFATSDARRIDRMRSRWMYFRAKSAFPLALL
jgi:hypothetical protein